MKLWVDDLRTPPESQWLWAKTSEQAIHALERLEFAEMSLDHDLGGEDTTRFVVLWLCEHEDRWPRVVRIHTANPVGRDWLSGMVHRYNPHVAHRK